jgi:hypothetical protein
MYSGTSQTIACSMVNPVTIFYVGSFTTGTQLLDSSYTPVYGYAYSTGYYLYTGNGSIYLVVDSEGHVDTINSSGCPPTPTPTPTPAPSTLVQVGLSNSSGDCGGSITGKYVIGGIITPGLILYNDSSSTSPVTGYNYVYDYDGSGGIYNLNSSSGLIGSVDVYC